MRRRISTGRSRRGGLSAIGWRVCADYPRYGVHLQVVDCNQDVRNSRYMSDWPSIHRVTSLRRGCCLRSIYLLFVYRNTMRRGHHTSYLKRSQPRHQPQPPPDPCTCTLAIVKTRGVVRHYFVTTRTLSYTVTWPDTLETPRPMLTSVQYRTVNMRACETLFECAYGRVRTEIRLGSQLCNCTRKYLNFRSS